MNVWLSWAGERADSVWVWNTSVHVKFGSQSQSQCLAKPRNIFVDFIQKWRPALFKKYEHDGRNLFHPTTPDSVAQGNPFGDVEWTQGSSLANYKSARALLLECELYCISTRDCSTPPGRVSFPSPQKDPDWDGSPRGGLKRWWTLDTMTNPLNTVDTG